MDFAQCCPSDAGIFGLARQVSSYHLAPSKLGGLSLGGHPFELSSSPFLNIVN
ncbi:MAG: hypothetical protein MJK14_17790 [Rivularia sp. ALOHA_DT_140]|nr:hypothetical protein [Rivularia sp. ALOHA_DT_140]